VDPLTTSSYDCSSRKSGEEKKGTVVFRCQQREASKHTTPKKEGKGKTVRIPLVRKGKKRTLPSLPRLVPQGKRRGGSTCNLRRETSALFIKTRSKTRKCFLTEGRKKEEFFKERKGKPAAATAMGDRCERKTSLLLDYPTRGGKKKKGGL